MLRGTNKTVNGHKAHRNTDLGILGVVDHNQPRFLVVPLP
jgi:hypothetical protein